LNDRFVEDRTSAKGRKQPPTNRRLSAKSSRLNLRIQSGRLRTHGQHLRGKRMKRLLRWTNTYV
jgi:hypothetical protein